MLLLPVSLLWDPYIPAPGATSIETLPIVKASIGVSHDEDLIIAFAAFQTDGVTPLLLAGITFTATVLSVPPGGRKAVLSTANGGISISSLDRNILTITDFASAKPWPRGAYSIRLLATDGVFTKEVFASSTITVGPPKPLRLTPIRSRVARGVLTPI